jgi:type IV secretory pathway protease TraF
MVEKMSGEMRRRKWPLAASVIIGVAGVAWPKAQLPPVAWNVSLSVPPGLYLIMGRQPSKGELAVFRLPEPMRNLATARGYLPAKAVLIKPVAARSPDRVCRYGSVVTINRQFAAQALSTDTSGRAMPHWRGCHDLDAAHLLVLSDDPSSFDGRYLGLLEARDTVGTATALWTVVPSSVSKLTGIQLTGTVGVMKETAHE